MVDRLELVGGLRLAEPGVGQKAITQVPVDQAGQFRTLLSTSDKSRLCVESGVLLSFQGLLKL